MGREMADCLAKGRAWLSVNEDTGNDLPLRQFMNHRMPIINLLQPTELRYKQCSRGFQLQHTALRH